MKQWKEESIVDYNTKSFTYTSFCYKENSDNLTKIYGNGFLPMSEIERCDGRFYEARSVRIKLEDFQPSSENRRVLSKFGTVFEREEVSIDTFDTNDQNFLNLCSEYLSHVHGINGTDKIKLIFATELITHISIYKEENIPKAYIFLVKDKDIVHFWFSFFHTSLVKNSFGMYLIIQELLAAKKANLQYLYLGTCYGQKGRYKLNFKPIEFWDGNVWNTDEVLLKEILRLHEDI